MHVTQAKVISQLAQRAVEDRRLALTALVGVSYTSMLSVLSLTTHRETEVVSLLTVVGSPSLYVTDL